MISAQVPHPVSDERDDLYETVHELLCRAGHELADDQIGAAVTATLDYTLGILVGYHAELPGPLTS